MSYNQYFQIAVLGFVLGIFISGIIAVATGNREKGLLFHIGIVVVYACFSYFVGGLVAFGLSLPYILAYPIALFVIFITLHAHIGLVLIHKTKYQAEINQNRNDLEKIRAELEKVSQNNERWNRFYSTGFVEVYCGFSDTKLKDEIIKNAESSRLTILHSDPSSIFQKEGNNELANLVKLLATSSRTISVAHPCEYGVTELFGNVDAVITEIPVEVILPNFIAIIIKDIVYFGFDGTSGGFDNSAILQVKRSQERNGLADNILKLVERKIINGSNVELMTETFTSPGRIGVCSSPLAYHNSIVSAEENAAKIDRMPKRISVLFKSDELIDYIAEKRFGAGNQYNLSTYRREHRLRKQLFFNALTNKSLICKEIYNKSELIKYVNTASHSGNIKVPPEHLRDMLIRWRNAILKYPDQYIVGLTEDPIPFKYQIIDNEYVFFHEAIGTNDVYRLNAFTLKSKEVSNKFQHDFATVWGKITPELRSPKNLAEWITKELIR